MANDNLIARVMLDQKSRAVNALNLFRPTEQQEPFVRQFAKDGGLEYLVGGGNRCLAGCQEIYDPVTRTSRKVSEIDCSFHVWSVNPSTGLREIKKSSRPFIKAFGELWKVTLSSGEIIHVTPEHRVVDAHGEWISIREAWSEKRSLSGALENKSCDESRKSTGLRMEDRVASQSAAESESFEAHAESRHRDMGLVSGLQDSLPEFLVGERDCEEFRMECQSASQSPRSSLSSVGQPVLHRSGTSLACEVELQGEQACLEHLPRFYSLDGQSFLETFRHSDRAMQCQHLESAAVQSLGCESRSLRTTADSLCDYHHGCDSCDGQIPLAVETDRGVVPSHIGVHVHNHPRQRMGVVAFEETRSRAGQCDSLSSRNDRRHLALKHFVEEDWPQLPISSPSTRSQRTCHTDLEQSVQRCASVSRNRLVPRAAFSSSQHFGCNSADEEVSVVSANLEQCRMTPNRLPRFPSLLARHSSSEMQIQEECFSSSHPNQFQVDRFIAVDIISVESIGYGNVWDITVESFANYTMSGNPTQFSVINANSGKTVTVAACFTAVLKDKEITLHSGERIRMRPERWRGEPLLAWCFGYNHSHIATVLYKALFRADLFRMIRDQRTGQWRAWDPSKKQDKDVIHLTKPSPPLIIDSDLEGGLNGISWENKKENQISSCTLKNGTRIQFYASTGARPQGSKCHLIWCDERLDDETFYPELLMRLPDYRGKLVWTSWPDTQPSAALSDLEKRAEEQKGKDKATAFSFRFKGSENPYTAGEHRDAILATMDEDTRRARDEGSLNMDRWRTYPRFSPFVHRAVHPDADQDDALAKAIRKINGIPPDWTRYLILDPGTANPAVLFVAVPPPELGDFIVPYDELYPHYSDAEKIAKLIAGKTLGQFFEDFIADSHACQQTPMGFSGTIGQNYSKHFAAEKLRCRRQGSNFSYGSDDVDSRIMVVQSLMTIRSNGTPKLRILGCPLLCKQLESYKWGADPKGNPTDKPSKYQKIDLAQTLEYFASRSDCGYFKPPLSTPEDLKAPGVIAMSIAKQMGIGQQKKPDIQTVYCGAGTPHSW